jgi:hypothetical protein
MTKDEEVSLVRTDSTTPKPPPRVVIEVPIEGAARIQVQSNSLEDEVALRGWLRRSHMLDDVAVALVELLDRLDHMDEERAA